MSLSLAAVFLVTSILLGFDFHTSLLIILCVAMIIVDMLGVMYVWQIELNAVTVVNIVMVNELENERREKNTKRAFCSSPSASPWSFVRTSREISP